MRLRPATTSAAGPVSGTSFPFYHPSGRVPRATSWRRGLCSWSTGHVACASRRRDSVVCRASKSELSKYRVAILREMCEERGLSSEGLKAALVERLVSAHNLGPGEASSAGASAGASTSSAADAGGVYGAAQHDQRQENGGKVDKGAGSAVGGGASEFREIRGTHAAGGNGSSMSRDGDASRALDPLRQAYSITWLGTSSGAPTSRRNVSSMALRLSDTDVVLVDCGEGTRNQMRSAKISPAHVSHIFITHLHGDHCFGIAGMLLAIMNARRGTARELEPVHIYGPPELHRLVAASCKAAQMTLRMPVIVTGFTLDPRKEVLPPRAVIPNEDKYLVALQAPDQKRSMSKKQMQRLEDLQRAYEQGSDQIVQNGLTWEVDVLGGLGVKVTAAQLQHRMPCWGYVFENVHDSRKIVLLGDTCDSEAIARVAMNCDVLSHEATYKVGMEDKARIATHSTSAQAGSFAARVKAKALVLTHFSARYDQVDKYKKMFVKAREQGMSVTEMQSSNVSVLKAEARETAGDGVKVYLANDYYRYEVK